MVLRTNVNISFINASTQPYVKQLSCLSSALCCDIMRLQVQHHGYKFAIVDKLFTKKG